MQLGDVRRDGEEGRDIGGGVGDGVGGGIMYLCGRADVAGLEFDRQLLWLMLSFC